MVVADFDHKMDATGIDGCPSVHDDYQSATLVDWYANRPHDVFAQFTSSNSSLGQGVGFGHVISDTINSRCFKEPPV